MLYMITGLPGASKTLFTLNRVLTDPQLINREVYYHGIPDLKLPWNELQDSRKWYECPDGCVIVIDEAQKTFPGRSSGSLVPQWVSEFETHRHRGIDVVLITQEPGLVDAHVRKLVERHFALVRPFGLDYAKCFEFHGIGDPKNQTDVRGAIESRFNHPKHLYNQYRSATLHAVKKRVPLKAFLLPALVVGLCVIGYNMYQSYFGDKTIAARAAATSQQAGVAGGRQQAAQGLPRSLPEYLDQFTPRHRDLPASAPIYDHLVAAVKDFPRIMGCMKSESKCWCYSQQGTQLTDIRPQICQAFVAQGGFFDPYKDQRRDGESRLVRGNPVPVSTAQSAPSVGL